MISDMGSFISGHDSILYQFICCPTIPCIPLVLLFYVSENNYLQSLVRWGLLQLTPIELSGNMFYCNILVASVSLVTEL